MLKLILVAAAIVISPVSAINASDEILAVDKAFSQLAKEQGRAVAYKKYMSANPTSLEQNTLPRYGQEALLKSFILPNDGSKVTVSWEPQAGKVAASGDMAYTWGIYTYRIDHNGETTALSGKYMTIWTKENGDWKLMTEMSNENPAE